MMKMRISILHLPIQDLQLLLHPLGSMLDGCHLAGGVDELFAHRPRELEGRDGFPDAETHDEEKEP